MSRGEVLRAIRRLGRAGRVSLTAHARERMAERNVRMGSLVHALAHATRLDPATDHSDAWLVTGPALVGRSLSLVVVIAGDVLVVTVWRNPR